MKFKLATLFIALFSFAQSSYAGDGPSGGGLTGPKNGPVSHWQDIGFFLEAYNNGPSPCNTPTPDSCLGAVDFPMDKTRKPQDLCSNSSQRFITGQIKDCDSIREGDPCAFPVQFKKAPDGMPMMYALSVKSYCKTGLANHGYREVLVCLPPALPNTCILH